MSESDTAIIRYVDADEGERYWRINRMGLVLSRKAMDRHVEQLSELPNTIRVKDELCEAVACQWPSRNVIYRQWEL